MKQSANPQLSDVSEANVLPAAICGALNLARKQGVSAARLCKGLGFGPDDLMRPDMRVSYRQTSLLVRRVQQALREPALGLASGAGQTIVSWGLVGLGMLASRTLGDAVDFAAQHQMEAGALLMHNTSVVDGKFSVETTPRFFDPDLEPYLVEDALASIVSFGRILVGARFAPKRIELAYPKPGHAQAYNAFFKCPVVFDAPVSRILIDPAWLDVELSSYDPYTSDSIRARLVSLMKPRDGSQDLLESAVGYLRAHIDGPSTIEELAKHLNLGERTLRRRLTEMQVSYRELVDRARYERSMELLKRSAMPASEIALAIGFSDVSNFRRAFKRWSGALPSEVRDRTASRYRR